MRYLMWRVTVAALDVSLLALGLLASWSFRLRRAGGGPGLNRLDPSQQQGPAPGAVLGLPR
jgi:hypothetical protein